MQRYSNLGQRTKTCWQNKSKTAYIKKTTIKVRDMRRRDLVYFTSKKATAKKHKNIPKLPLTAHRRPKNHRDTLVQASTSNTNTATGFQPCNTPRCKTCIHTTPSRTFTSLMNNKTYNIRHTLTCNSHNVIYLITWTKCKKQCVSKTSQQLRSRFTQHRFTINSDNGYPVARHFTSP